MRNKVRTTSDRLAREALEAGNIKFTLEPIFPANGTVDAKLVLRYPLSIRTCVYGHETSFMLASYLVERAVSVLRGQPRDACGAYPKLYLPVPLSVLADHRFYAAIKQNRELLNNAAWVMLMVTPDNHFFLPADFNFEVLATHYEALGLKLSVGEVQEMTIDTRLIRPNLDGVLPSRYLESNGFADKLSELFRLTDAVGVPMLTREWQPWAKASEQFNRNITVTA